MKISEKKQTYLLTKTFKKRIILNPCRIEVSKGHCLRISEDPLLQACCKIKGAENHPKSVIHVITFDVHI